MKYYIRQTSRRETINRFGKLGFVPYYEYVKTNKPIEVYNKGLKNRFVECGHRPSILLHANPDEIVSERISWDEIYDY